MERQRAKDKFKHLYVFFSPDCQFQWEGNKWSKCLPQIQHLRNQIWVWIEILYNLISISSSVLHIFYYNSCPISPITRIVLQNFYSSIPLYPWDISAQLYIFSTKFYLIVRLLVGIFIFGFMLISSIKMRNSPFSLTLK